MAQYSKSYTAVYNKFRREIKRELEKRIDYFTKSLHSSIPEIAKKSSIENYRKNVIRELKESTKTGFFKTTYEDQLNIIKKLKKNNEVEKLNIIYKKYTKREMKNQYIENITNALEQLPVPIESGRYFRIRSKLNKLTKQQLEYIQIEIDTILQLYKDENYTDEIETALQTIESL